MVKPLIVGMPIFNRQGKTVELRQVTEIKTEPLIAHCSLCGVQIGPTVSEAIVMRVVVAGVVKEWCHARCLNAENERREAEEDSL